MPAAPFWLYRLLFWCVDSNHHRAMFTETWLSTDPPVSDAFTTGAMTSIASHRFRPFGVVAGLEYTRFRSSYEEVFPHHAVHGSMALSAQAAPSILNAAAPEACFRLQRVGAPGSPTIGRLCLPILTDAYYTDLPHRRHVNAAALEVLLDANLNLAPTTLIHVDGRTYRNVIYQRNSHTWFALDHYHIMPNPIRIWQRWHSYSNATHPSDGLWQPPFL